MIGAGSKFFGGVQVPGGGGGGGRVDTVSAQNGLSLDPASTSSNPIVVLGADSPGVLGQLLDDRFIEFNGNEIHFTSSSIEKIGLSQNGLTVYNGANYVYKGNNTNSLVLAAEDARAGFMRVSLQNTLADPSAGVGFLFSNDLGHVFQLYQASSITDPPFVPDGSLLRSNGSHIQIHNDAGLFYFTDTPAFDNPSVTFQSFSSGNWIFQPQGSAHDAFVDDGNQLQIEQTLSVRGLSPLITVYDDADNSVFCEISDSIFYVQSSGGVDFSYLQAAELILSDPVFENTVTSQDMTIENFSTNDEFFVNTLNAIFTDGADPNINSVWQAASIQFNSDIDTPNTFANLSAAGLTVQGVVSGAFTSIGDDFIQMSDNVNNLVNVNPNNINLSDSTEESNLGSTSLCVNKPVANIPFATADIYGSISTNDPDTGLNDVAIEIGNIIAGTYTPSTVNALSITVNGVPFKLLCAN